MANGHGANASGAGGRQPGELCGLIRLYSSRRRSTSTRASGNVMNGSRFSGSSRSVPLNGSEHPFAHGLPGSRNCAP